MNQYRFQLKQFCLNEYGLKTYLFARRIGLCRSLLVVYKYLACDISELKFQMPATIEKSTASLLLSGVSFKVFR
jgi:hypothetical protein